MMQRHELTRRQQRQITSEREKDACDLWDVDQMVADQPAFANLTLSRVIFGVSPSLTSRDEILNSRCALSLT